MIHSISQLVDSRIGVAHTILRSRISGCTPEIAKFALHTLLWASRHKRVRSLADPHKLTSQDDSCVIAPIHSSGQPYAEDWQVGVLSNTDPDPRVCNLHPETDIRVVPHWVMGDWWYFSFVDGLPPNEQHRSYLVSCDCSLMVQTYAAAREDRKGDTPHRLCCKE
jgi:hypothetical protein